MTDLQTRILEVEADDDTGRLARALEAVVELHPRDLGGTPTGDPADYCPRCMDYWPCDPAQELHRTITNALGADDE